MFSVDVFIYQHNPMGHDIFSSLFMINEIIRNTRNIENCQNYFENILLAKFMPLLLQITIHGQLRRLIFCVSALKCFVFRNQKFLLIVPFVRLTFH